jgi:hypothetical protein
MFLFSSVVLSVQPNGTGVAGKSRQALALSTVITGGGVSTAGSVFDGL